VLRSAKNVLAVIKERYDSDLIYTHIGSILVSVNPFKTLPIYSNDVLETYKQGGDKLPPHVYGVAADAYNGLVRERDNHSGEHA
jgi:myosin heavy subunit